MQLSFALVVLCVVVTSGTFVYEPGSCREAARQLDVQSCMSGDFLCQWCEIDEDISETNDVMKGAITSEYSFAEKTAYVNLWKRSVVRADDDADKRSVERILEDEYRAMIEAIKPFNLAFPQRCARKWTDSTCPGKILVPITSCEVAVTALSEARDAVEDEQRRRRAMRTYREHSDHDRVTVSQTLQDRVSRMTDAMTEECKGESRIQNSPNFARSPVEIGALYRLVQSLSSKYHLAQYPILKDAERRSAFIQRYIQRLLPGNEVTVSESPAPAAQPHSCHQYDGEPGACLLAGCSYCRQEDQVKDLRWPSCQPAWDCKTCTKTGASDQFEAAVVKDVTKQMWGHYTDSGVFIIPEASRTTMTWHFAKAKELRDLAAAAKRTHGRKSCEALGTMSNCLSGVTSRSVVAGPACQWCEIPVDPAQPRCRSQWNRDGHVCYSPPLIPSSLDIIKHVLIKRYSAAWSEKVALIQSHMRDVRTRTPSGGSACAPEAPVTEVTDATPVAPAPPSDGLPRPAYRRPKNVRL